MDKFEMPAMAWHALTSARAYYSIAKRTPRGRITNMIHAAELAEKAAKLLREAAAQ